MSLQESPLVVPLDQGALRGTLQRRAVIVPVAGLLLLTTEHLSQTLALKPHALEALHLGIAVAGLALCWLVARHSVVAWRRPPAFRALLLLADGQVQGLDASGRRIPLQVSAFHRTSGLLWLRAESPTGVSSLLSGRSLTGDPAWAKVMAWLIAHRRRFGAW